MKTKLLSVAAAAGFSLIAGAASAVSISVSVFDIGDFSDAVNFSSFVVEDFEAPDVSAGPVGASLMTSVGTFSAVGGGVGTGTTCTSSGGPCDQLAVRADTPNSQGNLVGTEQSLNSNDSFGIEWSVMTGDLFNRVVFGISDATDQGATLTITADDGTTSDFDVVGPNLPDGNAQLVVIDFNELIGSATVTLENSTLDDGFAIDGASVGIVPLPAAGFLLIGGLGALGAMRRRQKS